MSSNKRSQRNLVQQQSRGSLRPTTAGVTLGCCASLLLILNTALAALRVPAFTSYLEPGPVLGMAETNDISAPRSLVPHLLWFGEFTQAGRVDCSIALHVPRGRECRLMLLAGGETNRATVKGSEVDEQIVSLGSITIQKPGYQRFVLQALNERGKPEGDINALILDGAGITGSHFNLKSRRNAASVHLMYRTPAREEIESFYCEVTAVEAPIWTFYMACGWHRGYLGMQVNSPTERQIIFSVWDNGNEKESRSKVAAADRVELIDKGDGVFARDFGNEGTGGHSHLVFPWKTGEKQRFLVRAKVADDTHTIYSGYYFRPDLQKWMLISSWKATGDAGYMRGLHSFSEDFVGDNGHLLRKALFGNQWARNSAGQWFELTTAGFSHDQTGKADRLDRFMGVESGEFFLSHGGFVPGSTRFGEKFERPPTGRVPGQLDLPPLPE